MTKARHAKPGLPSIIRRNTKPPTIVRIARLNAWMGWGPLMRDRRLAQEWRDTIGQKA